MPNILTFQGYRFYFYSNEAGEPPHIHVDREGKSAKFWLESMTLARSHGFATVELRGIARIISNNRTEFLRKWNEYFDLDS